MELFDTMEPEEIEKLKEEHGEGWSEYLMSLRDDVDELDRLDIE